MEDENYITQHHPDGSRTTIPKHLFKEVVEVHKVDILSRALAVGGMLIGTGALVFEATRAIVEPKQNVSPGIVDTVEAMQTQAANNLAMDCLNENAIRISLGFAPTNLEGCKDERATAGPQLSQTATPAPK